MDHGLTWAHLSSFTTDITGYVASVLVLATFSMKSMRLLRITAIGSNLAFIEYASLTDLQPILILHSVLLPVNLVRLVQIERERRRQMGATDPVAVTRSDDGLPWFQLNRQIPVRVVHGELTDRSQDESDRLVRQGTRFLQADHCDAGHN